jgi:hypothetical protein
MFKCGSREITRHYFSLYKRAHNDGIAEFATHLNTSHHRFDLCRITEGACLDLERSHGLGPVMRSWPRLRGRTAVEHNPQEAAATASSAVAGATSGDHKRLQIGRVERSIAFPEGSRLNPIVARR